MTYLLDNEPLTSNMLADMLEDLVDSYVVELDHSRDDAYDQLKAATAELSDKFTSLSTEVETLSITLSTVLDTVEWIADNLPHCCQRAKTQGAQ